MRVSEKWMTELSEGDLTDERAREIDRGLVVLQERYPAITDYPGSSEDFAASRGGGTGSRGGRSHEGRRRSGSGRGTSSKPKAKAEQLSGPGAKPVPGLDPTARRRRAKGGSRQTPRVDRAIAQTGIPATAAAGGSLFMSLLGLTVGLSLLYLVFTSAETRGSGARAVPSIVNGVTRGLGRFLSLADIFPAGAQAAAAPSSEVGLPRQLPKRFRQRGSHLQTLPKRLPRWELEAIRKQTGGTG